LYGTSASGGAGHYGTLFSLNTDGTEFTILHNFTSSSGDGGSPYGGVVSDGAFLYGTTIFGGSAGDGIVFAVAIPEPPTWQIAALALVIIFVLRLSPPRCAFGCSPPLVTTARRT